MTDLGPSIYDVHTEGGVGENLPRNPLSSPDCYRYAPKRYDGAPVNRFKSLKRALRRSLICLTYGRHKWIAPS